ncbi:ankyrin repeat domain-containing protein [Leptospira langatensis]|uniref:Ankyrin repeat domain-containing protein n=2 Tax=Leptospira langatensis TaxID=2484983 RepID=A0A5F1ZPQ8_9LEPT|nr:ankyrin repeat domain-containing protein [Leptospira langatensis]TGK02000.1 ankyrin repeat domain-containing protein [Leptospira langatensis]TGL39300.1 ankyrin repeat domain-containing protein [Leptospira langatensis]
MKSPARLFFLTTSLLFSFGSAFSEETKFVHPTNAIGGTFSGIKKRAELPSPTVSGAGLKAVAIVGEVDGSDGLKTREYMNNIKGLVKVLKDRGVSVSEFYPPNNPWSAIKEASQNANIVLYAGHGVGTNLDQPPYDQKSVGGFYLGKEFVSNEQISSGLKPAPGAIVLFLGACFTAGNMAYDMGMIRDEETTKRISMYSSPFLETGFKGYYATWAPWTAQTILALLFTNKTYGDIYFSQTNPQEVTKIAHPRSSGSSLYYHIKPPAANPIYDYAFAGDPSNVLRSENSNTNTETTISEEERLKQNRILISSLYDKNENKSLESLEKGADPNADYLGWKPIHLAIVFDLPNVVKELVRKKASINAQAEGYTPLSMAIAYERKEIAEILEKEGGTRSRAAFKKPNIPTLKK